MDSSADHFDDSPEGTSEDSDVDEFGSDILNSSIIDELEYISGQFIEDTPIEDTNDSPSHDSIEDSDDDQDHDSIAETPEGSVVEDSEGDLQGGSGELRNSGDNSNHNQHYHDSTDDLDLDIADGISSSSIPDDIDLEEVFLRAAGEDSPIPEWALNTTRAPAMPLTTRVDASASQSRPEPSQAAQDQETAQPSVQPSTNQTATLKRGRSPEADGNPGPSSAAGPSSNALPPISSLLESLGGSSRNSQASLSQSGVTPKRPRRQGRIALDDLFSSDDEGVEVVNLVDVDRPGATQDDPEILPKPEAEPEPEPEKEPEPEPESATLVKLSGIQCVICMDDMSNLTVTHCGHLFCGECLHSSLIMAYDRRICPICRTKLELRVEGMSASKMTRSYFPLVVKTRSANRQGKQPVRP